MVDLASAADTAAAARGLGEDTDGLIAGRAQARAAGHLHLVAVAAVAAAPADGGEDAPLVGAVATAPADGLGEDGDGALVQRLDVAAGTGGHLHLATVAAAAAVHVAAAEEPGRGVGAAATAADGLRNDADGRDAAACAVAGMDAAAIAHRDGCGVAARGVAGHLAADVRRQVRGILIQQPAAAAAAGAQGQHAIGAAVACLETAAVVDGDGFAAEGVEVLARAVAEDIGAAGGRVGEDGRAAAASAVMPMAIAPAVSMLPALLTVTSPGAPG